MNNLPHNLPALKAGWFWVKLGDVGKGKNAIVDGPFGSNLKTSDYIEDKVDGIPVLTTKNLEGDYSSDKVRFISKAKFEELKRSEVKGGDILIAKIGSIGKLGIYPERLGSAMIPANLLKFTVSDSVSKMYVYYYLSSSNLQKLIKSISTATAQPAFNVTKFRKLPIPLPPLPEQKKIVEKIEELFSGLDSGVASLKNAKEQIKLYRQSVLAAAFSGRLLQKDDICKKQNSIAKDVIFSGKAAEPNVEYKDNGLPEGWKWVKLGEVVKIVSGNTPKGLEKISNVGDIPFYKVSDMNSEGNEKIMHKSNLYLTSEELRKLKIKIFPNHTTIFPKRGGAILTNKKRLLAQDSAFDLNLMGVIPSEVVNYQFLHHWILKLDLSTIYDGSNVPQINNKNVEPLDFPLPTLNQQTQIVEEIEKRFSEADNLEKAIDDSLTKAVALRQSILKQAFEGKLI